MEQEPLNYFILTSILLAILLMGAQNLSMLSGKWRNYYILLFFVKILLTSVNAAYPGKVPMSGVDCWNYMLFATGILAQNPDSILGIIRSDQNLFVKEVAAVYYFFGINNTYMYFLVCFGSLIAFKYMVLMAKEMTENDELAQKCGILYLAWPILLIYASTFLRENQSQLLFILSFYNFVRFVKRHNQFDFVCAIFWGTLAAMTHSGMIALVVCYAVLGSMVTKSGEIKFSPVKLVFGFILLLALMASPFASSMTERFQFAEDAQSTEELANTVSSMNDVGGNTRYYGSLPTNPIMLLLLEPYLFLMFVFAPLPFQVHSFGQGIAFLIDAVPQFFLVHATYQYLVVERKKGTPQIMGYKTMGLWLLLLVYFIFSLGVSCYGTAMRHRAKVAPLLIVFAVMYYAEKKGIVVGTKENEEEKNYKKALSRIPGRVLARIATPLRKILFRNRLSHISASRPVLIQRRHNRFIPRQPGRHLPKRILPFRPYVPFGSFPQKQGKEQPFDDSSFGLDGNSTRTDRCFVSQDAVRQTDNDFDSRNEE